MPDQGKRVAPYQNKIRRQWVLTVLLCCLLTGGLALGALARPSLEVPEPTPAPAPMVATPHVVLAAPTRTPSPAPPPTPTPTPVPEYDFTQPAPVSGKAGEEYFADAVFLGDSRTDGLRLYSGIRGADFLYKNGVTVFDTNTKQIIKGEDGKKYTMLEALKWQQYGKVYIMLGINELGYGSDQGFYDAYAGLIDSVRGLQPDAVIYIESIIPINPEKAKANKQKTYITNEKIAEYNALLKALAEEKQVVFLDLATALTDENGILPADACSDGIHFKKSWYIKWYEYLQTHTVPLEQIIQRETRPSQNNETDGKEQ